MNKRFLGVLFFAFVVASVASLLLYRLLNKPQPTKAALATTQLVVATHDIEVGAVIKEADVAMGDWGGPAPLGASARPQDLVGRGVMTAIYAKEPIIESRLAPKGAGGGLAALIPPGMRAVAIHVNDVVGVAGFVVPGMHVDVLISGNRPRGDSGLGTQTKTLLQNLEVLSAGQDIKKDNEGKPIPVPVVNILVTPEQAEQLSLASSQTQIQLVLRNPLDREVSKPPGTALDLLFSGNRLRNPSELPPPPQNQGSRPAVARAAPRPQPAPVAVAPPPPPAVVKKETPFVMEILSGSSKRETKFENGGEGK